jgi:hypothetical protein
VPPERALRTRGSEGLPACQLCLLSLPPPQLAIDFLIAPATDAGIGVGQSYLLQAARGSPSGNFTVYLARARQGSSVAASGEFARCHYSEQKLGGRRKWAPHHVCARESSAFLAELRASAIVVATHFMEFMRKPSKPA